jgi:hypothetical protein
MQPQSSPSPVEQSESVLAEAPSPDLGRKPEIKIFVNTKPKEVESRVLSFADVIALAQPLPSGPNYEYTVDYRKAAGTKHKGELLPGETVEVKDGTIFDVTATDKS